ncbi:class I SAM-dependent methyltransferase [Streptomyces sp. NPDC059837]|uniref:class I SAM-dependent methyltransferase n=1 Tax=unclassified Streptomyces TaxID=2593676 RepID=UPI00364F7247
MSQIPSSDTPESRIKRNSPESINIDAWTAYGTHHIQRATDVPEVNRRTWGFWPTGPGAEVLGELTGRRVLDLASGLVKYAAYLAREHGALVDAVDASPTQYERARARYSQQPGLNLVLADAVEYLRHAKPYDLIYSVNDVTYIAPRRLLPALAAALKPDGRLVFSALHQLPRTRALDDRHRPAGDPAAGRRRRADRPDVDPWPRALGGLAGRIRIRGRPDRRARCS